MRNIDQAGGLCNDTRIQIKDFKKNIMVTSVITEKHCGEIVFIPKMYLVPTNSGLLFKFGHRQFSISLCFAMTINKSKGKSLSKTKANFFFFYFFIYLQVCIEKLHQLYFDFLMAMF
jgi:hypothetical protein